MDKKRVLHVGSGIGQTLHAVFDGWKETRLDIDPNVRPDIVASMTHMRPVANADYDAIFSKHNLEHLEYHEVVMALREFRRVLKPGGFALIIVPDLEAIAEFILQGKLEKPVYMSDSGPIEPIDMLYGYRPALEGGRHFMAHRTGFTQATLLSHLNRAGFFAGVVRHRSMWELWAEAQTVQNEPNHLARIFGKLPMRSTQESVAVP
jgi:SAM-dependent methyltransferase